MSEQTSFFQRPVGGILGAVALLLLWAFPAMAAMHLDIPARAARGDAIRVQLTNLVLYIATPAAILQSFTSEIKTPEKTKNLFLLFCIFCSNKILKFPLHQLSYFYSNCSHIDAPA